jgi:hypothetical protein
MATPKPAPPAYPRRELDFSSSADAVSNTADSGSRKRVRFGDNKGAGDSDRAMSPGVVHGNGMLVN